MTAYSGQRYLNKDEKQCLKIKIYTFFRSLINIAHNWTQQLSELTLKVHLEILREEFRKSLELQFSTDNIYSSV